MNTDKMIRELVAYVEQQIAQTYDLTEVPSALDHLINAEQLHSALGDQAPQDLSRAALVVNDVGGEAFVGIFLDESLKDNLCAAPPMKQLHHDNLDAFTALVEEVSHFLMLTTRLAARRSVSRLELEFQGEMDKMLAATRLLQNQSGDPHVEPLTRLLFDCSVIVSGSDRETYHEANRVAGRFWHDVSIELGSGQRHKIMEEATGLVRDTYQSSWTDRRKIVDMFAMKSRRRKVA